MKTLRVILLFAYLMINLTTLARAQEWRKIVPIRSTRADVERLLGSAGKSFGVVYELEIGNLSIEYSTGLCGDAKRQGWNVPEDVVISYTFSTRVKQRLADLNLDEKKFKRVKDTHTEVIDYYINDEEGIMYEVQGGRVDYVEYYPSQTSKNLYCGDSSALVLRGKTSSP